MQLLLDLLASKIRREKKGEVQELTSEYTDHWLSSKNIFRGAKSIVMLIFLLFSGQTSGGGHLWKKARPSSTGLYFVMRVVLHADDQNGRTSIRISLKQDKTVLSTPRKIANKTMHYCNFITVLV